MNPLRRVFRSRNKSDKKTKISDKKLSIKEIYYVKNGLKTINNYLKY